MKIDFLSVLEQTRKALHIDISERRRAQDEVRKLNAELEQRVAERTAELEETNRNLANEIAQRKRAEESLYTIERQLESMFNSVTTFIGLFSTDGRILRVNDSACSAIGLTREEVEGDFAWEHWVNHNPELQAQLQADFRRAANGETVRRDYRIQMGPGKSFMTTDTIFKPFFAGGLVQFIVGEALEVTAHRQAEERLAAHMAELEETNNNLANEIVERRRAEAALQKNEEKFRALVETSVDAIVSADGEGTITHFNRSAGRMFGYGPAEAIGWPITVLIPERFLDAHRRGFTRYLSTGEANVIGKTVELAGRKKDGTEFPVEISLASWRIGDETYFTGIMRDLSQRKRTQEILARQAQELARSNADLEQFAYIASHDLQEPLRMVESYTQLLARRYQGKLDAGADDFIGFAVDGVARMKELINDLLAYSRVGSKAADFVLTDCNVVLDRTLANLSMTIEQNQATITRDPLPTLRGDPSQLGQLFQNLIGNAIKFIGDEPPRVHVSAMREREEWLFSVSDNGTGIDPQYADRIFQIFQRLHSKSEYPGTGIGLTICRKIVERHGGRIWVKSELGKGATFYFTLSAQEV